MKVSMNAVNDFVSDGVYTLFKKTFLLFHTALLKCFICSRAAILYSSWCNNSCRGYQELGQGHFNQFDQEKVPFVLTTYPQKNVTTRKIMPTPISPIVFVLSQSRLLQVRKTSEFLLLLLFQVIYPPSTTTLRFPHS